VSDTYVCSSCGGTVERSYGVQYIVLTCPHCDGNGRFVHDSLVGVLDGLAAGERPEDWEEMRLDERLLHALREGLVDREDVRVA
jgi:hypothetical protein